MAVQEVLAAAERFIRSELEYPLREAPFLRWLQAQGKPAQREAVRAALFSGGWLPTLGPAGTYWKHPGRTREFAVLAVRGLREGVTKKGLPESFETADTEACPAS